MVRQCCYCKKLDRKEPEIIFHLFPKYNQSLRQQWIKAIPIPNFIPKKHWLLCSEHFTRNDYCKSKLSRPFLKCRAVPTVFPAIARTLSDAAESENRQENVGQRFPQNVSLKDQWISAIRRENFKLSQYSRICSKHFTADSFITNAWSSTRKLASDAVPSIFDFEITTRDLPATINVKEVKSEDTTETTNNETTAELPLEPSAKRKRLYYLGDFNKLESSSKYEHYKRTVKNVLVKKNRQIKILKQSNRRLIKRVSDLKSLLKHWKQQHMISEESSLKLWTTLHDASELLQCEIVDNVDNMYKEEDIQDTKCNTDCQPNVESAEKRLGKQEAHNDHFDSQEHETSGPSFDIKEEITIYEDYRIIPKLDIEKDPISEEKAQASQQTVSPSKTAVLHTLDKFCIKREKILCDDDSRVEESHIFNITPKLEIFENMNEDIIAVEERCNPPNVGNQPLKETILQNLHIILRKVKDKV